MSADAVRAALALGHRISVEEMATLQADVSDSATADLLRTDVIAATGRDDLALELRRFLTTSDDITVACAAALHPDAPEEMIEQALGRQDVRVRLRNNPEALPPHVLTILAQHGSAIERGNAARATTDPELLDRLSYDDDNHVRIGVVVNRATPDETRRRLADDEESRVRAVVARAMVTPPDVVEALSFDPADTVRMSAATNSDLSAKRLGELAEDPSAMVRKAVAGAFMATNAQLQRLLEDEVEAVRETAQETLDRRSGVRAGASRAALRAAVRLLGAGRSRRRRQ
ncbi:MAG: hypothetical protein AAF567_14955 [Actinomycetota bacterium]